MSELTLVNQAYQLGTRSFLLKPLQIEELTRAHLKGCHVRASPNGERHIEVNRPDA